MKRSARRLTLAALSFLIIVAPCLAHTTLPAYLEINERNPQEFDVVWKIPVVEGPPPAIYPVFPEVCKQQGEPVLEKGPGFLLQRSQMKCTGKGLTGERIEITGLPGTLMDALVRIAFANGAVVTRMLHPAEPGFVVESGARSSVDAWGYLRLGMEHILYGIDHLFFVLGLLLIVRHAMLLFKTITAFTVAHTITLGLAVAGFVRVPTVPVEAAIALSIVFLAQEIVHHLMGKDGLTYRKPWLVAFSFGLLHGFGFAATLSKLGIPRREIPEALLLFNCGVELGQLAFVVVFVAFVFSLKDLQIQWPKWSIRIPPYAIGSLAMFWFLQRCVLIFR